jgi:sortase A
MAVTLRRHRRAVAIAADDTPPRTAGSVGAVRDWRWWVGGLGRVLIATGLLMFGFVAYQLWGTGLETARAQNSLEQEFAQLLDEAPAASSTVSETTVSATTAPETTAPGTTAPGDPEDTVTEATTTAPPTRSPEPVDIQVGDPIARLEIPAIGVDSIVIAGVDKSDLKRGPGHYPDTPLPGQLGNSAIAGHRTTYGQPFFDVDQLQEGDEMVVTTLSGRFVYRVTGQQIVTPSDYQVVTTNDPTVATLTLTSCHPKWTARDRIIVTGELDEEASSTPAAEPVLNYGRPIGEATADAEPADAESTTPRPEAVNQGIADAFSEGWFSDPGAFGQVALWGGIVSAIALAAWALSRRVGRNLVGLAVGMFPFLVALYFFFQNVNRLLPPGL